MGLYVYYSIGTGSHESIDDVAICKALTFRQAKNKFLKYVKDDKIEQKINKITFYRKYDPKSRVKWISEY